MSHENKNTLNQESKIHYSDGSAKIYGEEGALNHFAPKAPKKIELHYKEEKQKNITVRRAAAAGAAILSAAALAYGAPKAVEAVSNMPGEAEVMQRDTTIDAAAKANVVAHPTAEGRPVVNIRDIMPPTPQK